MVVECVVHRGGIHHFDNGFESIHTAMRRLLPEIELGNGTIPVNRLLDELESFYLSEKVQN